MFNATRIATSHLAPSGVHDTIGSVVSSLTRSNLQVHNTLMRCSRWTTSQNVNRRDTHVFTRNGATLAMLSEHDVDRVKARTGTKDDAKELDVLCSR